MCTSAEYDVTLSRITQELESSIKTGSLSYTLKLVVMNLPNSDTPLDYIFDIQHDLACLLVVDDYSFHGEQVNF